MPVFESDDFASLNPENIRKTDVTNKNPYIKDQQFNGMVRLNSFENDFGPFKFARESVVIEYAGIQHPRLFHNTIGHENTAAHIPDFPNILYFEYC
jgi:hypothetical protein